MFIEGLATKAVFVSFFPVGGKNHGKNRPVKNRFWTPRFWTEKAEKNQKKIGLPANPH